MTSREIISALTSNGTPLDEPEALEALLTAALTHDRMESLLEAAFHAKFLVKTQGVMRRVGPNDLAFKKLSSEYQSAVERVKSLIQVVVNGTSPGISEQIESKFFSLEPESFMRLLALANDLSRLKNWDLDRNAPPASQAPAQVVVKEKLDPGESKFAVRSAVLLVALLVSFLILEPPVTVLGYVLAFMCVSLAVVNGFSVARLRRSIRSFSKGRS